MIYGYVHCSKNLEVEQEQKEAILLYAQQKDLNIENWIETSDLKKQKKLEKLKKDDVLIVSNIYRLGMSVVQILEIVNLLIKKGVVLYSAQDDLKLGDELTNPIMIYCFDLVAKIVKEQNSQQAKEALCLLKKSGKKLGRPQGVKNKKMKLEGAEKKVEALLKKGLTKTKICQILDVSPMTLRNFISLSQRKEEDIHA